MTEKNEALRLADEIAEMLPKHVTEPVAAELRRLSIDNDALGMHLLERVLDLFKVETQRDALLEALKIAVRQNEHDMLMTGEELRQAYAAIAKATGGDARCSLCRYEHGHAIGCDNNPVDKALTAIAKVEGQQ